MNGAQQSHCSEEIFLFLFLSKKENYIYGLNTSDYELIPAFCNNLIPTYY